MNESTNHPDWMNDDAIKNISPQKLAFLEKMFQESHGKTKKEMMPFLMSMMQKAKRENLTFTPAEMNAAVAAIKKHSSEEELHKINKILEHTKSGE